MAAPYGERDSAGGGVSLGRSELVLARPLALRLILPVFRHFVGAREFNPLAVVFRPFRPARVFRFWQPFREWKHGKPDSLARLEGELFAYLGIRKEDRAWARNCRETVPRSDDRNEAAHRVVIGGRQR